MDCKVKMRVNLGSRDSRALSLDHSKCVEGEVIAVGQDVADFLVRKRLATAVEEGRTVKAVPDESMKAVSEKPKGK